MATFYSSEQPQISAEFVTDLTPEERSQARDHWLALMFARCSSQLEEARMALKAAPHHIQKAVTNAVVALWREGRHPVPGQTPFD